MVRLTLSTSSTSFEMDVPIRADAVDALKFQLGRLQIDAAHYRAVTDHLGLAIAIEIGHVVDWDLCKPTKHQVRLAKKIMRVLAVGLPHEALLYQSAMNNFLDRHRAEYQARRRKRT